MTSEKHLSYLPEDGALINARDRQGDLRRLTPPIYGPFLSFSSPPNFYFKKVFLF